MKNKIEQLIEDLLMHNILAVRYDGRVKKRVDDVKQLYANKPEEQLRAKLKVDYDLNDHLDRYRYHCGEVQRISAVLTGLAAGCTLLPELNII